MASQIAKEFNEGRFPRNEDALIEYLGVSTLVGADLSDFNLCFASLKGVNLCGANLSNTILDDANLTAAALCNANLSGSSLIEALMYSADLTKANLTGATIDVVSLEKEILGIEGAILKNVQLAEEDNSILSVDESAVIINKILQERWGYMLDENGVVVDAPALKPNTGVHIK